MFKKILIANRGEIAVRIIRACRDMEISPVAVYSDADRTSLHVRLADEAHFVGPARASESYLCVERLLDAGKRSGADAIHPGYGFLAENAAFAQACKDAGLVFIGPSASSIERMGSKLESRRIVAAAGVPTIPGSDDAAQDWQAALKAARRIGFPVMIKASAGGGGKGMRVARNKDDLKSSFETARGEAGSAFDDSTIYLEKYIEKPRHIEVQLLGDRHGGMIFLGERECSIQRRHQKLVEECPSPAVTPELREQLGRAAMAVARAVDYYNAGTVEFLYDAGEEVSVPSFYFLEMNTRLQVEHPVTEMTVGIDLVREQIRIAAGEKLEWSQQDVRLQGSALQCRIYAEDPQRDFAPSPGLLETVFEPSGPGIRNDCGVYAGFEIPLEYDPLISKLIAHGKDRSEAIRRMRRALAEYKIGGVKTTISFFERLLSHPAFEAGDLHTHFIEQHGILEGEPESCDEWFPCAAAAIYRFLENESTRPAVAKSEGVRWKTFYRGEWE
ncbi:MAG TPA: acetyl-CoA carboxylase biotin carboxylase subunit [Acidobacteriota bacterium]|nr:acetyl-CoA carboxylase biotin carboxylase subunit [Acidobacteriota bacterium]